MGDNNGEVVKKRRGRKPKSQILLEQQNNVIIEEKPSAPKKRGRKPKGGKIITELENKNNDDNVEHNVILHLKCNSDDLNIIEKDNLPESFQITSQVKAAELNFNSIDEENIHEKINEKLETNNTENLNTTNIQMKTIWKKIKELQKLFYFNNVFSKKSACFWCTCEFDNPAIYIPKYQMNDNYHVYGCFCSPECSVSYLMNENIDTSQKFERYQMLTIFMEKHIIILKIFNLHLVLIIY